MQISPLYCIINVEALTNNLPIHHFPTGNKTNYIYSLILVSRILFIMHTLSFYLTSQRHKYWNCLNNYIILWHTNSPHENLMPDKRH